MRQGHRRMKAVELLGKAGIEIKKVPAFISYKENPEEALLPKSNLSSSYVFAKEDYYFCYPNNYNHFVNYYRNTFQHGGVSIEEMIVPVAVFESK